MKPEIKEFYEFDDSKMENINQSYAFNSVHREENFLFSYGRSMLVFRKKKINKLTHVYAAFPNNDEELIKSFIKYCNHRLWIYNITSPHLYPSLNADGDMGYDYKFSVGKSIIKKPARYDVRKAINYGVKVKLLDTWDEWKDYAELHRMCKKGWFEEYKDVDAPPDILADNLELLFTMKNKSVIIFAAYLDNKMISGTLFFIFKRQARYTLNCTVKEYYMYFPTALTLHIAVEHFKNTGIMEIRMPTGIASIIKRDTKQSKFKLFKSRWGEREFYYTYTPRIQRIIKKVMGKC